MKTKKNFQTKKRGEKKMATLETLKTEIPKQKGLMILNFDGQILEVK